MKKRKTSSEPDFTKVGRMSSEEIGLSKLQAKADQMNLAMDSVGTDHLANLLLNEKIKDAYLFKIKVKIENKLGILLILVSTYAKKILYVYSLAGNTDTLLRFNAFEDQQRFIYNFILISNESGVENELSDLIGRAAHYTFTEQMITQFSPYWELKKIEDTLDLLHKKIKDLSALGNISLEGELERVNSVPLRYNNRLSGHVKVVPPPQSEPKESSPKEPSSEEAPQSPKEFLKKHSGDYLGVLRVKSSISPTEGIRFSQLKEEHTILCKPILGKEGNPTLANSIRAVTPEGEPIEISGKFLAFFHTKEDEYHIFAQGPENVLLHSIDSKELKIALQKKGLAPDPTAEAVLEPSRFSLNSNIIIGIVLVLISIVLANFLF